jgi:hypothetical protein
MARPRLTFFQVPPAGRLSKIPALGRVFSRNLPSFLRECRFELVILRAGCVNSLCGLLMRMKSVIPYFLLFCLSSLFWACEPDDVVSLDGEYRELLLLQQADSSGRFEGGVRFGFPDGGAMGDEMPLSMKMLPNADFTTMRVQHISTQTTVFSATIYGYTTGVREIPATLDSAGTFIRQSGHSEIDPRTVTWLTPAPDTTGQTLLWLWSEISDLNMVARFVDQPHFVAAFHYAPALTPTGGDLGKYYWIFYR